jgi:hypothetical protein
MAIFLSPGVYSEEKVVQNIVRAIATASAGIVGYSAKGSVDEIKLITNDQQFIDEYGPPDPTSGHYFHYAALAYLAKGSNLYCLRVANSPLYGGVDIMQSESSEDNAAFAAGASSKAFAVDSGMDTEVAFQVIGVNPGVWNDKLAVTIEEVKDGTDLIATDQYTFKINVNLQDDDGNWSEVESWKVSRKHKVDGFGKQLYLMDKINGVSKYIWVLDSELANTVLPKEQEDRLVFDGGSVGGDITSSELVTGWEEFENDAQIDVRLLINGGETAAAVQTEMKAVAEGRADCIAILDIPWASLSSVADMVTFRNTTQNFNSSYCTLFAGWCQVYDRYNDILVDVPPSGHVAAQMAYNDYVGKPWTAPAGYTRGMLDVLAISGPTGKLVFTKGERDTLYVNNINPLQKFEGEGFVIWGQKTLQKAGSPTDRINVRRLLIVLEKSMAVTLRPFVFEPNDEVTRFRIESLLNSYLGDLSAQGAFQVEADDEGFRVVCDETNNTAVRIDANELWVDVFVKPSRTAEFIQLRTIVTSSGASFEELIARGV